MRSLYLLLFPLFLFGCNEIQNSNQTDGNIGTQPPSFNLVSVVKTSQDPQDNSITFRWDGNPVGMHYAVCSKDLNQSRQCRPLGRVSGKNELSIPLQSLIKQFNQPIFILAQTNESSYTKSNERYLPPEIKDQLISYLTHINTDFNDHFGFSVAINGDASRLVVGVPGDDGTLTDTSLNSEVDTGAVYVFERIQHQWREVAFLKPSGMSSGGRFGHSVAVSDAGEFIAVGAPTEKNKTTPITAHGAAYVFRRVDGKWQEMKRLTPSYLDGEDEFGYSIAFSRNGHTLIIGAPGESSGNASDEKDNTAIASGAAYIYKTNHSDWLFDRYLKASNIQSNAKFGFSVSASSIGSVVAIGAPFESSDQTNVGGQNPNLGLVNSGAVYLFEERAKEWTFQNYLKASNAGANDHFGHAVSLDNLGHHLLVGAPLEDSSGIGVNGNDLDNTSVDSGAAYLFRYEKVQNLWAQTHFFKAPNRDPGDKFGTSVALSIDAKTMLIGAPLEKSDATGLLGNMMTNTSNTFGAAYSFQANGPLWEHVAYLKPMTNSIAAGFGQSLSMDKNGDVLVVGSPQQDTGSNPATTMLDAGAVYVY